MNTLETEIKELIIESLNLEEVSPTDIDSEEPLFVEGLGLDSIDALELGVALRKKYDIKIESVNEEIKVHFRNVKSLARFVQARTEG